MEYAVLKTALGVGVYTRVYVDFDASFMRGRAVKLRKAARKAAVRETHTWIHTKWHLAPGVTLTLIAWQWRRGVGTRLRREFELLASSGGVTATSSRTRPLAYIV